MALLDDYDLDNVPEESAVEPGEYTLGVVRVSDTPSKRSGAPMIMVTLEVVGEPTSQDINYTIMLPKPGDTEKQVNRAKRKLRNFIVAANVGLDTDEWLGATLQAVLDVEESDEYGLQNRVKQVLIANEPDAGVVDED